MHTFLKSAVARTYAVAGGLRRLHAGRLVVLTFHRLRAGGAEPRGRAMRALDVETADFRRILARLSADYEPVALADWLGRENPPPRPAFAVTFDDGWTDNYEQAFPVLRELGVPATIFLATGAVAERMPFWWQLPGLSDAEIELLKRRPHHWLEERLAAHPEFRKAHEGDFLSWEQVREMGRSGLVTFGPHGHRHALLDQLPRAEALADVGRCWSLLREHVPDALAPVLAWPNGNARADLDADLAALGLRAAVGTDRGAVGRPAEPRWNLPRNNVDRRLAREPGLLPWLLLRAR